MFTNRFRVINRPAAALTMIAGLAPGHDVLLDAVLDSDGEGEIIVSASTHELAVDPESSTRLPGLARLHTEVATRPERVIHLHVRGWLRRHTLAELIVAFQETMNLSALAVRYDRVNTHELLTTESADFVFGEDCHAKVHSLCEHLKCEGYHAVPSGAHELGALAHPAFGNPGLAAERYVLHLDPGVGIASDLYWLANKHRVALKLRGVESSSGVAVLLDVDGPKRSRIDLIQEIEAQISRPRRTRAHAVLNDAHGHLWIEARGPRGGALRLTAKAAHHGLGFRYLQTGQDKSTDLVQGILDVGDKHPWRVARHLRSWAGEHHLELQAHTLAGASHDPDDAGGEPIPEAA